MTYADTSVVMAMLTENPRQEEALVIVGKSLGCLAITDLLELEFRNAVELAVFQGIATPEAAVLASDRLGDLLGSARCRRLGIDMSRVFSRSRGLSVGHSRLVGTRSLDILHVASAMELGVREFRTFDERQLKLARAVGLNVGN